MLQQARDKSWPWPKRSAAAMQPQATFQMGPADLARLFACLREAMSTDAGVRSRAEAVLQLLEEQPGYCSCLAVGTAPLCLDTCFTLANKVMHLLRAKANTQRVLHCRRR